MEVERVACFIDGFNLYHAIARLGEPHLKWLDLCRVMQRYVRSASQRVALHAEELTLIHPITGATVTFTAPLPKDLRVALKYLREHGGASLGRQPASDEAEFPSSPS